FVLGAEKAAKPLGVLGAVLDDQEPHAGGAGKQAPTAFFHGGSSGRTTRCPCHSRVRSRTSASPRPLSRCSMASSETVFSAESPTSRTVRLRPAASRSSP